MIRLAHLADLHLGFRQFNAETAGQNTREVDVAAALRRTVDDVIAHQPDAVVIAGDLMHSARPRTAPIMLLFNQLRRIREALPDTKIVIVAGNHDVARTMEFGQAGCILPLYEHLGVEVAVSHPKVITLPGGVAVTAVPHAAVQQVVKPDSRAALNVLVIHGEVPSHVYPHAVNATSRLDVDELERMGWDYIALGDYHVCHQVGPQMWYSGSIEYTSTDPWGELRKQAELGVPGKGYLLVSVEPRKPTVVEFRPIGPTRRFVDLPPIEATGMGAPELNAAIASRVAEVGELDGAVVRLVVREVTRDVREHLDYAQVRAWKGRALHLQLELRRAVRESSPAARAARFRQLDEQVAAFLGERTLAPEIDRAAFVERGLELFRGVGLDPSKDPYTGLKVPGL